MSKVYNHVDRLNRPIAIDDCVATSLPYDRNISIAKVVGFTPKMVKVSVLGQTNTWTSHYNRYPHDMVILDSQAVTYYLLSKGQ